MKCISTFLLIYMSVNHSNLWKVEKWPYQQIFNKQSKLLPSHITASHSSNTGQHRIHIPTGGRRHYVPEQCLLILRSHKQVFNPEILKQPHGGLCNCYCPWNHRFLSLLRSLPHNLLNYYFDNIPNMQLFVMCFIQASFRSTII